MPEGALTLILFDPIRIVAAHLQYLTSQIMLRIDYLIPSDNITVRLWYFKF